MTWSEVAQWTQVVAAELASHGSPGDRVAILASHGLEYIAGVLGAMAAGFIAVPLPAPMFGNHDDRVCGALIDSAPVAVLTTTANVNDVDTVLRGLPGSASEVIEIDALDLYAPPVFPPDHTDTPLTKTALLQYTSGSTRVPAGVMMTHANLLVNLDQIMSDYFEDDGGVPPAGATLVSWLPFYHDMGLMFGVFIPVAFGLPAVLMSPTAFLTKPARWLQLLARNAQSVSPAPNFAFELAARRTSDADLAGLDLGGVLSLISGAERVHPATLRRFMERFAAVNLPAAALRAAYGLAEATVYVASSPPGHLPATVRFSYQALSDGHATRCGADEAGSELVGHGPPRACAVRIVDPETGIERRLDEVGEIWVHGGNVAGSYWHNPALSKRTFDGHLVDATPGTPPDHWLRTGDLGVISGGELFVVGRIKDLLIVDGRNHYPDDIEATIQEITGGRVAAIGVADGSGEQLVVVVEVKKRGESDGVAGERLQAVERDVRSAISRLHGVRVADLVLVPPGAIPITTSGKVRRSACVDCYRHHEFARLAVPA